MEHTESNCNSLYDQDTEEPEVVSGAKPSRSFGCTIFWLGMLVFLAPFTIMAGVIFPISFLSVELMNAFGISQTGVGLVIGATPLAATLCGPLVGYFYSILGCKLVLSLGFSVAALGVSAFAFSESLIAMISSRFVLGVGQSLVFTGVYSMIPSTISPEKHPIWFGITEFSVTMGVVTVPIGGLVRAALPYRTAILVSGAFVAAMIPFSICVAPGKVDAADRTPRDSGSNPDQAEPKQNLWSDVRRLVSVTNFVLAAVSLNTMTVLVALDAVYAPQVYEYFPVDGRRGNAVLAGLFGGLGVGSICSAVFSGVILRYKRNTAMPLMLVGQLIIAIGVMILRICPGGWLVSGDGASPWIITTAGMFAVGVGMQMSLVPVSTLTADHNSNHGDRVMEISLGVMTSLWSLGELIGPVAGSALVEHHGFKTWCDVSTSLTLVVGFIVCARWTYCLRQGRKPNALGFPLVELQTMGTEH